MKNNLDLAAKIALGGSPKRSFWLGAVAKRKDGAIVVSTNEKVQKPTPTAHAEARVLRKAGKGATLWVGRVMRSDHSWAMAKPCKKCQALIRSMGVVKVYYTISPGNFGVWYPQKDKIA